MRVGISVIHKTIASEPVHRIRLHIEASSRLYPRASRVKARGLIEPVSGDLFRNLSGTAVIPSQCSNMNVGAFFIAENLLITQLRFNCFWLQEVFYGQHK